MNEKLYRPISCDDLTLCELSESIKKDGILDPLSLSEDFFIISGHIRFVASEMIGLSALPCYVRYGVRRDSGEFLKLAKEFNRHRVKGIEGHIEEAVVDASETRVDAEANLIIDHVRLSYIDDEPIEIVGIKKRAEISKAKSPFLMAIIKIIDETKNFLPLSDRQIHYRLLNNPPLKHAKKPDSIYVNTEKDYQSLAEPHTWARLEVCIS